MFLTSCPGGEGVDVPMLTQPEAVAGGHSDLVLCPGLEAGQLEAASVHSSLRLPGLGDVGGLGPVSLHLSLGSVQLHLSELPLLRAGHSEANDPPITRL